MTITWHAQVLGVTNVSAKLEGVSSKRFGPVIDELNLVLALEQRAIAATHVEAFSEFTDAGGFLNIARAVSCKAQLRESSGERITQVDSRNAGVLHRSQGVVIGSYIH